MTGARINPAIPIARKAARQSISLARKAPIRVPAALPIGIPSEKIASARARRCGGK